MKIPKKKPLIESTNTLETSELALKLTKIELQLKKHSIILGFIAGFVFRDANEQIIALIKLWLNL